MILQVGDPKKKPSPLYHWEGGIFPPNGYPRCAESMGDVPIFTENHAVFLEPMHIGKHSYIRNIWDGTFGIFVYSYQVITN